MQSSLYLKVCYIQETDEYKFNKGMRKLLQNFTDLFKKRRIGVVPDDFIVSSHASAEIALEYIPASNVNRICSLMIHWCDKN